MKKLTEVQRTWVRLGLKAITIIVILTLCFGVFVGMRRISDISMNGRVNEGDFILFNRIAGTYNIGDVVFYEKDGQEYLSEIIGSEGDLVTINDEGFLLVNEEIVSKSPVFDFALGDTNPFGSGIRVPKGSFFVLNSNYESTGDSRTFGPINANKIKGNVIALMLRTRSF